MRSSLIEGRGTSTQKHRDAENEKLGDDGAWTRTFAESIAGKVHLAPRRNLTTVHRTTCDSARIKGEVYLARNLQILRSHMKRTSPLCLCVIVFLMNDRNVE